MESLVTVGVILVVVGLAVYRLSKKSSSAGTSGSSTPPPTDSFGTGNDPGDENDNFA